VTWWQGAVLGVVQGLTEFLPVSSSGHLVVTEAAVGFSMPGVMVEVVLHVATLLAVVIVYWRSLLALIKGGVTGDRRALGGIALLVIGTVPAGLAGFFLKDFFEGTFESLLVVGVDFVITGTILWSVRARTSGTGEPSLGRAGMVGLAQACAILPGISRSGTTIATGLWLDMEPTRAAEFSFLLAIPAIAGAAVLQLPDITANAASVGIGPLALSFVAALVSGVLAIRLLILLLRRRAFHVFAPYCWVLGAVTIVWALLR
jgi:undecaprenyl-diphosphatase